jgi:hypothetical protein
MTTFLRLLETDPDQKAATLANAAARWRSGSEPHGIFQVEPSSFAQVPGSPFAYWVSERVRSLFTELPAFKGEGRTVKQGLATADDFRFVRCWWEVAAARISEKWFPFAKGGSYSPFYADVHLVVNWEEGGREMYCFNGIPFGGAGAPMRNTRFYFRPGLTWPLRTNGLSFRRVGRGAIFGHKGPMAFVDGDDTESLLSANAVLQSTAFLRLVQLQLARTDLAQSFEVGLIGSTPFPTVGPATAASLARLARSGADLRRGSSGAIQTAHAFTLPALVQAKSESLAARADAWSARLLDAEAELTRIQSEIDDLAFGLYDIEGEDRRQMEGGFGSLGSSDEVDADDPEQDDDGDEQVEGADLVALTEALLEWVLGVALGRFDVRLATGERMPPPDPDPFDPLPVCSPGMLQDAAGLPAREAPAAYPLELPPHGILVDDPGHQWDVVARMETVFERVAEGRAHDWIQEAEGILGRDLRDWLRRYGFERHLKRYSRSRRKAPLFWHLAPRSREYGIWLYSPVATRDIFYRVQNDYLEPKLKAAERRLLELRQSAGASPTGQQRKDLASQESLVEELRVFREQVARIAPLWKPYRDDGVVLNCAVSSGLFDHHRTWQKECAKKWGELAGGKYDWAGWAMHLWPARVVAACASDRSIAIAHGLEEALWQEGENGKWEPRADAEPQVARLVAEHWSPAVQAALDAYERAG